MEWSEAAGMRRYICQGLGSLVCRTVAAQLPSVAADSVGHPFMGVTRWGMGQTHPGVQRLDGIVLYASYRVLSTVFCVVCRSCLG